MLETNPVRGFEVDRATLGFVGTDLQRPECILAERDGMLWVADARGGVVRISPDGTQTIITQTEHTAFAFVTDGAVRLGPSRTEVRAGQLAVLGRGDRVVANCDASSGRMVLIAGRPIGEPVARGGPFVMNTQDEIRQAWADYRAGRLLDDT